MIEAPADAALPAAQKFCSMCGAASPTEGIACAPCAARLDRPAVHRPAPARARPAPSPIAPPADPALPGAQKFCSMCGAPSPTEGFLCAPCAARIDDRIANPPDPALAKPRTNLGGALALYFTLLAVCIGGTVVGEAMPRTITAEDCVRLDAIGAGILSAVVFAFCLVRWRDIRPGLLTVGHGVWYAGSVLGGIGTFLIATAVMAFLHHRFGVKTYEMSGSYRAAGSPMWLPILTIAVQPAVFEELAFRGFIDGALRKVLGPVESLLLTAFLFVFLHLSPLAAVHLFSVAIALGIIRRHSGSLYPCMLLHFTHNGLVLGHELLFGGNT